MAKICVVGAHPGSLSNFRGDLIKAMIQAGHEVLAMAAPADDDTVRNVEGLGAKFLPYSVRRTGLNPFPDINTLISLRKAYNRIRPDVVLAYTIKPVIWSGFALRRTKDVRFYTLITGLGSGFSGTGVSGRSLASFISFLYRSALKRSSGVIFQNPDNRDAFVEKKIVEPSKCRLVNGSGVNLERFQQSPLPERGTVFLTIARLLIKKGIREYARAAEIVKNRHPEADFRLLGPPDPSRDSVPVDEVKAWDKAGLVTYLGEAGDVRPALRDCHLYVLPSSYNEGVPRTVLEAMSMGRPILTTDAPGCRETVKPGENGFLVPKGDAGALAERMIWFLENRGQWERMGRASRAFAEERFDVHKVNRQMMTILGLTK